ncbi:peptidoglycan-binding protein [Streptomyces sp. NBC_00038]|uniref:peptidoglycan-binding protein n=1 Tax=Streptomyces sp. NBC_00038 TaxID=2903615 RepID=UPI0022534355|nr:peptidoglycan-binding protein [Streptomyces sp. NBC_00038]MCX5561788.1 peptidoglycan-binding protein [Streptomyces sp. NBC_00038]
MSEAAVVPDDAAPDHTQSETPREQTQLAARSERAHAETRADHAPPETEPEPEPTGPDPQSDLGQTDSRSDPAQTEPSRPRRHKRRGRKAVIAVGVIAAVGGAAAAGLGLAGRDASGGGSATQLPPATTDVTRQTLKDSQSEDGELGYGAATSATGRLPGTVTELPDAGEEITRGKALYEVDDKPVTLMYGTTPAYRDLKPGVEGADVKALERNLDALGYSGFTVDDEYTDATADAVKEWQEDRGLDETGAVELGRVVFAPAAVRVDAVDAEEGAATGPGQKVLSYTGTTQVVTLELDTADQRLAKKGTKVAVELPDGTSVGGRIQDVSTEIDPGDGGEQDPSTKVKVTVALDGAKAQKAAASYVLAAVNVFFTAGERRDVLTVPIAALVALPEGGFGVEVVQGSTTAYVAVETGLFANGRVEITGEGITEGTKVGMPA